MQGAPIVKDLVLVGGGHAHVAVLKQFGMRPVEGVRLTLVTSTVETPYSGMLPGFVAGWYSVDDIHIDLRRLARFARARLVLGEARGLDLGAQRVLLRGRPPVSYDVLSLNVGITPALSQVPGAAAHTTPVKPIAELVQRVEALLRSAVATDAPLRVVVVGGGAGGVELACALQHRLARERRRAGILGGLSVSLVSRGPILHGLASYARRAFLPLLQARGVQVHEAEGGVVEVQPGMLLLADGSSLAFDHCLWSTQASAAGWLADTGLPVDADGFLTVDDCLRSAGGPPNVFAAGDCASSVAAPRPKAGVFAVRAGPPLAENLRRVLTGAVPRPWKPQTTFLSLISAGDKYAVATKGMFGLQGAWLWHWKDRIDRAFMASFTSDLDFEAMEQHKGRQAERVPHHVLSASELALLASAKMRCGGCGSKVGAASLGAVLQRLRHELLVPDDAGGGGTAAAASALLGLDQPDDAAVVDAPPPGHKLVHTVDFFRAMIADPFVFGQIAANHALSDCYAMGATPTSALALAVVPLGAAAKMEEDLYQLMAGAVSTLQAAGCSLIGGHSSEGGEMALGFAVNGIVSGQAILTKGGMQSGQAIILTKPLGTGILLAAEMRGGAKGRWVEAAVRCMQQSNQAAAAVFQSHGATACTDVTGFGLLGHLAEMARASCAEVALEPTAVPLLDGGMECAAAGYLSSLHTENAKAAADVMKSGLDGMHPALFALLVDPQTSGGLLASVPAALAERCVIELRHAGCPDAAVVASVLSCGTAAGIVMSG